MGDHVINFREEITELSSYIKVFNVTVLLKEYMQLIILISLRSFSYTHTHTHTHTHLASPQIQTEFDQLLKYVYGDFLDGPAVKNHLPMQGTSL